MITSNILVPYSEYSISHIPQIYLKMTLVITMLKDYTSGKSEAIPSSAVFVFRFDRLV